MENYQAHPTLLKDKLILVTGAGDGLGCAAALS
ncbi:MAG: YciK family oxidoreductase, partial [Pseudomonadota bacterium]